MFRIGGMGVRGNRLGGVLEGGLRVARDECELGDGLLVDDSQSVMWPDFGFRGFRD